MTRTTTQAVEWLQAPERTDTPWAAFVSFVAPHYPLSAPEEFAAMYPGAEVPPPEIPAVEHSHPAVAAMHDFFNYGSYFDDETVNGARAAYFALCSFMDDNVGQVLAALDATGQRATTRIIYTSDHGELLGNRGLWCKSFMFEDSVGVPMIVSRSNDCRDSGSRVEWGGRVTRRDCEAPQSRTRRFQRVPRWGIGDWIVRPPAR